MDRELPAKIWVPILAACALIPAIFSFGINGVWLILLFGALGGFGLTFRAALARRYGQAMAYGLGAMLVLGIVVQNLPPPTPEELAAQQEQLAAQQQAKARHDYLLSKKDLSASECAELHGNKGSEHDWFCEPIMSDEAWRQFQGDAARSHEYSQVAHDAAQAAADYSDALQHYVETYHHLPPNHVVIDPH